MSAFEDIRHALGAATVKLMGWTRVVLVGISAERAIIAHATPVGDPQLPEKIDGVEIMRTREFEGWAIRDMDPRGKWHEVEPAVEPGQGAA